MTTDNDDDGEEVDRRRGRRNRDEIGVETISILPTGKWRGRRVAARTGPKKGRARSDPACCSGEALVRNEHRSIL